MPHAFFASLPESVHQATGRIEAILANLKLFNPLHSFMLVFRGDTDFRRLHAEKPSQNKTEQELSKMFNI
jgi:hypothetical protein